MSCAHRFTRSILVYQLALVAVLLSATGSVHGQVVPWIQPARENWEGLAPPFSVAPGGPANALGASWSYAVTNGVNGRLRVIDAGAIPAPAPPGTAGNGPTVVCLDRSSTGTAVTNMLVLHFDGLSVSQGSFGIRVDFALCELGDEIHPEDTISVFDGQQEFTILSWNQAGVQQQWREFSIVIDPVSYPGMVFTNAMELRFSQRDDFPAPSDGLCIDNIALSAALVYVDLACVAVVAPYARPCGTFGAAEPVVIRVQNQALSPFPAGISTVLTLMSNGVPAISETWFSASPLVPGQSLDFTFATTLNLGGASTWSMAAMATVPGDVNPANDTSPTTVSTSPGGTVINQFPYVETFDAALYSGPNPGPTSPPPGWSQEPGEAVGPHSDWYFRAGLVPTPGTGPLGGYAPGGGVGLGYAYVEDEGDFPAVWLWTPCFDLTSLALPTLDFRVCIRNANPPQGANSLHVDLEWFPPSGPGGPIVLDVIAPVLFYSDELWHHIGLDLSAYAGQFVRIRFRATSHGGGSGCDVGLDHVRVAEREFGVGQIPTPGLATLELVGARSISGLPLSPLSEPGPYWLEHRGPHATLLRIEGLPNSLVTLALSGLCLGSAFIPGSGQLDLCLLPSGSGFEILGSGSLRPPGWPPLLTDTSGTWQVPVILPPVSPGTEYALQAAVEFQPGGFRLSNAVAVRVY